MNAALRLCFVEKSHFAKSVAQGMLNGYDVHFFDSGEEAWQSLVYESRSFDVIVTDLDLPGMTGLELIQKIRNIDRIKDIPIILVSSEGDHKMMVEGLDAGADEYLTKPYSQERLAESIQRLSLKKQLDNAGEAQSQTLLNTVLDENDFLKNVFNTVSDSLWILDTIGNVARVNQSACDLLDCESKNIVGKNIDDFLELEVPIGEPPQLISASDDLNEFSAKLKINEKERIPVILSKKYLSGDSGEYIGAIVTAKDVAEQQKLQKQVFSLEKWRSLGEMAAGIAHEVNNPVAIIRGWAENMEYERKQGILNEDELESGIKRIVDMTERITKIIQSLRVLARDGSKDEAEDVTIRSLVDDCTRIYQKRVNEAGISFSVKPFDESLQVFVQRTQIAQVLLNLIVNAFDAVQGNTGAWVSVVITEKDREVEIRVTDSGTGIPVENHEKIFEPFFSTKDVKSGVGMGLSLSKAFVEHNNGRLMIDPDAPNTTFILALPKDEDVANAVA